VGAEIREESIGLLHQHAAIPAVFRVETILEPTLEDRGIGGILLRERPLREPYQKDYDALAGGGPAGWPARFDVSRWGLLVARWDGEPAGGAVIAWNTPGLWALRGRSDLAALWDLRVRPDRRRRGIATHLLSAAAAWARQRGCSRLEIETQNTNVAACRFYVRSGCTLAAIDRHAYPELPHESRLLWSLDL
jgi:ribosomal protein S18 acetylase RimI-like enzyme